MDVRSAIRCLAVTLLVTPPSPQQQHSKSLKIYWIDVEGGAATLVVTPAGESVLIDAGYPDQRGAPRIRQVATEIAGLTRIDHLIVTHFHIDHFGGAAELSRLMPIGRVYDNGLPSPPPSEMDAPLFQAYTDALKDLRTTLKAGDHIPLAQNGSAVPLTMKLLGTRQTFVRPEAGAPKNAGCAGMIVQPADTTDNANSTAWMLEFGRFRFFDGGDLTWNIEAKLVCPVNLAGKVDVYQVDHHGLDVSNNPVLIRSMAPTVTVMNNAARKGTEPQTMATLRRVASIRAMYQVHKNTRQGKEDNTAEEYIANPQEPCSAQYLKLSVDPSGSRYTMTIPASGHSRTYPTR